MSAPNSSGVLPVGKMRAARMRCDASGSLRTLSISPFSRCTTSRGVPAGTSTPYQNGKFFWSKPAMPLRFQARHVGQLGDAVSEIDAERLQLACLHEGERAGRGGEHHL